MNAKHGSAKAAAAAVAAKTILQRESEHNSFHVLKFHCGVAAEYSLSLSPSPNSAHCKGNSRHVCAYLCVLEHYSFLMSLFYFSARIEKK